MPRLIYCLSGLKASTCVFTAHQSFANPSTLPIQAHSNGSSYIMSQALPILQPLYEPTATIGQVTRHRDGNTFVLRTRDETM